VLRDRWQTHIDASLSRPVLIVDEAQEMLPAVLAELRLLSSTRLDSHILLTVVLAGDGRLLERLRSEELAPLGSLRVRLALERAAPDELRELLLHGIQKAGAVKLMTPELIATLADRAQGNLRALMTIAGELLAVAAQREVRHIDEKLFLETCAPPAAETRRHRHGADESPAGRTRMAPRRAQGGHRWLIAGLWSEQAVGIVGGEPKCCKSFLALDIAVAVAAGIPCLRRFAVPRSGRVMLYAAEDALHIVRHRFDGICEAAGVALADLDIQVITAPTLRLDLDADRNSLADTVARLQPRLLILDPFVRLHRIDENASGECSPICANSSVDMRRCARRPSCQKRRRQRTVPDRRHAWGDSNL
jgi:hypothetical protein